MLSILATKRTKIGRGRGDHDGPSLDSVGNPLPTALFEEAKVSGFPLRRIAWNLVFSGSAPSLDSTSLTLREHLILLSPGFSGILVNDSIFKRAVLSGGSVALILYIFVLLFKSVHLVPYGIHSVVSCCRVGES